MKKMTSHAPVQYFLHRGLFRLKAQLGLFVFLFATLNALGQNPPSNNTCEGAIAISCGQTVTGNTVDAESSSLSPTCAGGSLQDVYYSFTGLPGQTYTVTVNGDDYDGVLVAYSGSCGDLDEIDCADDGFSSGEEETITFTVPSIQTVYIQTYDWSPTGGSFSLTLSCSGTANPPANNSCFISTFIPMGETVLGSTISATPDGPEIECGFGGDGTQNDVWYAFTAPNGNLTIETTSTGVGSSDTQIQVLDGCSGEILGCDEDGGVGLASLLEFECGDLNPGQLYYIQVDAYAGLNVNFNISVTTSDPCPAPSNDLACNAIDLSCGDVISGTTIGATSNTRCGFSAQRLGVWYKLDLDVETEVSLETCLEGTTFDTDLSLFTGSCTNLDCYTGFNGNGYLDGESSCEFQSFAAGGPDAVFTAPPGSYYILVHGFQTVLAGNFELAVSCEPTLPPENNLCIDAIPITCGQTVTGNTVNAESSSLSPSCAGGSLQDVYYSFTGLPGQTYTVTVNGDDYDGVLVAYSGSCGDLEEIACADDGTVSGVEETITFTVPSIQTVYIQTYDWSPTGGSFSLTLSCSGTANPPANNSCFISTFIPMGETVLGSTISATPDGPEIECGFGGDGTQNDVWYAFTAPNGNLTIETTSTGVGSSDTQIQVLDGCSGEILGCDEDGGVGLASLLEFECGDLNPGQLYYIQVDAYAGLNVNFNISVTTSDPCPVPSNDLACNAIDLSCGDVISGTTIGATSSTRCGSSFERLGVWYKLDLDFETEVSLETCFEGTTFDTDLSVFTGPCSSLECFSGFSGNGYHDGDPDCEFQSWAAGGSGAVFTAPAGSYYIMVHGFSAALAGNFELSVSCDQLPPENDSACDAIDVSCGDVVTGSNINAALSERCGFSGGERPGVWYQLDVETLSEVTLETCLPGTNFDTDISVFTGSCSDLTCFDGFAGNGYLDGVSSCEFAAWAAGGAGGVFTAPAGTYFIMVHGFSTSDIGAFELSIECEPIIPDNDLPCDAISVSCGDVVSGNNINASLHERCGLGGDREGVWYQLDLDSDQEVTLETCLPGTDFDTDISVFTGTCSGLTCFAGFGNNGYLDGDFNCGIQPWAAGGLGGVFTAPAGTYFIMVHGFDPGLTGNFELAISCETIDAVSINGSVNWNSDCGERAATMELYEAGTANFAASYAITVNAAGNFNTVISETGSHDIYLKVDGYLSKVSSGVSISNGSNSINFGAITPGDITGNNSIGIGDFSGISTAYGTSEGDAAYNALADFNCDGTINIQDYSSFSSNYGSVGDQPGL